MKLVCDDPDGFAKEAARNPKAAGDEMIRRLVTLRKKLSLATTKLRLAAMKSFLDYEGARLNWKCIRSLAPAQKTAAHDRAPTAAEIRKLLEVADLDPRSNPLRSMGHTSPTKRPMIPASPDGTG